MPTFFLLTCQACGESNSEDLRDLTEWRPVCLDCGSEAITAYRVVLTSLEDDAELTEHTMIYSFSDHGITAPDITDEAEDDEPSAGTPAWEGQATGPAIVEGTGRHYLHFLEPVRQLKREHRTAEAIDLLERMVDAVEREAILSRDGLAPWYFNHLAIEYRKAKRFDDEVALLERYEAHTLRFRRDFTQGAMGERLKKARTLATRHQLRVTKPAE